MATGPQNSVIGDDSPLQAPEVEEAPDKEPDDFRKLGKSKVFPDVAKYIDGRVVHYQKYLPSGLPITGISKEERAEKWALADTVITELNDLKSFIEKSAK